MQDDDFLLSVKDELDVVVRRLIEGFHFRFLFSLIADQLEIDSISSGFPFIIVHFGRAHEEHY